LSNLDGDSTSSAKRRRLDPRSLLRELRGDLDWIAIKALDKNRSRRYETAHTLAMDIRRHLDHEPVLAGPPSTAYKLSKFVRRHRAGVVAFCVAVLSLVAAAVISAAFGLGEAEARREAENAQKHAEDLVEEISALKEQLEQESAETLGLYKQVFAEASDAIMTFDYKTGEFTEANQATLDLLGYTKEEFLKLKVTDISAEVAKTGEAVRQVMTSDLRRVTRLMKKEDGTELLVEIHSGKFTWQGRSMLLGIVQPIDPPPGGRTP
jgi:PAS domain S-box-containing protein